jgi:hypothetical protein
MILGDKPLIFEVVLSQKQTVVEGALKIPKDVLCNREMGLTWVMHVETHLMDCVGDIRLGEGEVLENSNQTAVGSLVADGGGMLEETLV